MDEVRGKRLIQALVSSHLVTAFHFHFSLHLPFSISISLISFSSLFSLLTLTPFLLARLVVGGHYCAHHSLSSSFPNFFGLAWVSTLVWAHSPFSKVSTASFLLFPLSPLHNSSHSHLFFSFPYSSFQSLFFSFSILFPFAPFTVSHHWYSHYIGYSLHLWLWFCSRHWWLYCGCEKCEGDECDDEYVYAEDGSDDDLCIGMLMNKCVLLEFCNYCLILNIVFIIFIFFYIIL